MGRRCWSEAIAALKGDEAAALKAFNDEKNKEFRDRDLYVYCFSLPDGNLTAYQSPVMIGGTLSLGNATRPRSTRAARRLSP
jgi:hypothetical protein